MKKSENLANKIEALPLWVIFIIAAALYLPLTFLGYGSDSDARAVVRTGEYFIATFDYVPSRLPGFFVHEVFSYFLNIVGGSLLTNLGTVGMTLLMLASFYRLSVSLVIPRPMLLTLLLALHPIVWVNASSTIDYLWALGFAFFGFNRLFTGKYFSAVILLALAIGCRLSTLLLVGFFNIFMFFKVDTERNKLVLAAFSTLVLAFIFFIPPLDFLEWDLSRWLVLSTGDPEYWTPLLRIGRFAYKNIMFWGLPAAVWLMIMTVVVSITRQKRQAGSMDAITWLSIAVLCAYELLFLFAPIELEYLLPLLPFTLILLSRFFHHKPNFLLVLLVLVFLANFLWINPARSTSPNQTSDVIYGLWLEKGYLLQDVTTRLVLFTP